MYDPAAPFAPTSRSTAIANGRTNSMHSQNVVFRHGRTGNHRVAYSYSAVKVVADVFIQSLVLAGLCSDHAPRKQLSPILKTTKLSGPCALTSSQVSSFYKKNTGYLTFGRRRFSFPHRISQIHTKSLSTYATARQDPDDRYHDISNDIQSADANSKSTGIPRSGTSRTAKGQSLLRFVPGKGPSEWPRPIRRRLGVPPRHLKPSMESKARIHSIVKRIIAETRSQESPRSPNFKLIKTPVDNKPTPYYIAFGFPLTEKLPEPKINKMSDKMILERRRLQPHAHRDVEFFVETLEDGTKSNHYIFSLYKQLPWPGVKFLTIGERRKLLHRFSHPPDRRRSNARNYLKLFDDMYLSGFRLSRSAYTSAIYFIAHKVPVLEERDLRDALTLWHRMEKQSGIDSDNVVFELLFKIASGSGHFTVADRLMSEMKFRGLQLSRNGQVSLIRSYGERGDVEGILQAFDSYVKSGQIVDTVVHNCLISSLLRAGALHTAEQLYFRMMAEYRDSTGSVSLKRWHPVFSSSLSPDFPKWKTNSKRLELIMDTYRRRKKRLDRIEKLQPVQEVVPIAPDTRTYQILLQYHCTHTGDLMAISRLLLDMEKVFRVPPRPIIYYFLFQGFGLHSEAKGWTAERLMEVWRAFRRALYESYTRMFEPFDIANPIYPKWENPLRSICEATTKSSQDYAEEGKNIMEMFDKIKDQGQLRRYWYPEEKKLRRIANGVFLSRNLNILMLKAFGTHCDTKTLLRVFSEIERMWRPWKRLTQDVQSVKKELQKQLVKANKKERDLL